RIAGEVRGFRPADFMPARDVDRMDPFIRFAVAAAREAADDARLRVGAGAARAGAVIGVGFCGITTLEATFRTFLTHGLARVSPLSLPRIISNLAAGHITMQLGLRGISFSISTACASGAHAIGEAARLIRLGAQDVVVAGGCEAPISEMGVGSFCAMRALSTRNAEPEAASRPFDRERDGFVIAEGAGILVLEALDHALARGARIRAELVGYGANSDAYHIAAPLPDGAGAAACMRLALADGGIALSDVDYINAHGSSTAANDRSETAAIKLAFGEHARRIPVSSTKSMTGHLLGGAGGIEAAICVLALERGIVPATINYETPDPECDLDYVPNVARRTPLRV